MQLIHGIRIITDKVIHKKKPEKVSLAIRRKIMNINEATFHELTSLHVMGMATTQNILMRSEMVPCHLTV